MLSSQDLMSSGSRTDHTLLNSDMKNEKNGINNSKYLSKLLELSAEDDINGFISEVEEKGCHVNESSFWYGRRFGSKKMGFEERTPLLISAMYGSVKILKYLISSGKVDINKAYGFDKVTALHCAAGGGSSSVFDVIKMLIDAGGDIDSIDASGNKPIDILVDSISKSKSKTLEMLLKGGIVEMVDQEQESPKVQGIEKKGYPIDVLLPDINIGLYGSDEFRMYSFKVKLCSRAYSHDWTECPFVHPGENARRRDPSSFHYSCVPCPEFKKGNCAKGDTCEYAHGVFESWLHPAQYKTRLCKDETACARKVCFFAHKVEELRPLYASTGSAIPSPKCVSSSSKDMASISPLTLGSTGLAVCSSPMAATSMWQNHHTPPTMQLPSSRLKTTLTSRDLDLEMERIGLDSIRTRQQLRQHLIDEMSGLSSPSSWSTEYDRIKRFEPTNLDNAFGSLQSLSPGISASSASNLQSSTGLQLRQNMSSPNSFGSLQSLSPGISASSASNLQSSTGGLQLRQNMSSVRTSYPSSRARNSGFDTSAAVAAAVMNSRSSSFANRSQSFIDRRPMNHHSPKMVPSNGVDWSSSSPTGTLNWGSPTGKLDWGFNSDDANKFRKSASFALQNSNSAIVDAQLGAGGIHDMMMPSWIDQMYLEQEQMVA